MYEPYAAAPAGNEWKYVGVRTTRTNWVCGHWKLVAASASTSSGSGGQTDATAAIDADSSKAAAAGAAKRSSSV